LNVIKGDMSVVGPRPERPHFVEKFKNQVPRYLERHRAKTGMTGWAQVNGLRGNASIAERTKYDIYYIEHWSLVFDLKIILKTIHAVLFGRMHTNQYLMQNEKLNSANSRLTFTFFNF
jgi:lipopolysaccharide/colanic/teichoic acid biosynthesis glycosyltransferase